VGARFSAPVQTGPGAHPASCALGTGFFPGVKSGRGVTLTSHPLLVPWSWMGRVIPVLSLWAVRHVQSLSACTRVHLLYFTTIWQCSDGWNWPDPSLNMSRNTYILINMYCRFRFRIETNDESGHWVAREYYGSLLYERYMASMFLVTELSGKVNNIVLHCDKLYIYHKKGDFTLQYIFQKIKNTDHFHCKMCDATYYLHSFKYCD
jgi:hypothetical protein